MKKVLVLILLFSTLTHAQQPSPNDYKSLWKEVSRFDKENLPKSANEIVQKILEKAKKESNTNQLIKSLLYQSKYMLVLEEDAQLRIVNTFKSEIVVAKFPEKNILESILANMYWQYFQENRWRFYDRTHTDKKVNANDFRTWDLQTLFAEIHLHFQQSLDNALLAQTTPLEDFNGIIDQRDNSKVYRPTLYDFLAHNALDFYKTDETNLSKPAYKFVLDNPDYLDKASTFKDLSISTKDTLSLQFNALLLYQNLIRFHLHNKNTKALVVVDLERLAFVKQHASFNDKESVYLKTLLESESNLKSDEMSTLYSFEIASHYKEKGQQYQSNKDETAQWELKKAKQVCEQSIARYPESLGAKKCKVLLANLVKKSFDITAEKHIPINKESRVLLAHKNTNHIFFRILRTNVDFYRKLAKTYNDIEILALINTLPIQTEWEAKVKNESDFQRHQSELIIPKLPRGNYLFLVTDKQSKANIFAYTAVQVTNIALLETNTQKQQIFQVVDRNNGIPLQGAVVHLSNKNTGKYDKKIDKSLRADEYGQIYLPKDIYYNSVKASITYKDDKGEFGNYYLQKSYVSNHKQRPYNDAYIFTDRSIYRPGQTLYFKAIAVTRKPRGKRTFSEVLANEKVLVELRDVNRQSVSRLELLTNDFGSVSGTFVLPANGLTGNFTIKVSGVEYQINTSKSFAVEEYKRPKFQTKFMPVSGSYKVNDTVKVTGVATAYAGNAITEAKVVYRVHRKIQFPRWWYWYRPAFSSEPQEILHGETQTDAKGNYEINFKAQPDVAIAPKDSPIFNYEILADVTDINGETHSTKTLVKVGYNSAVIQLITADKWNRDDKEQSIQIITKNLNNQPVSLSGRLKIYKIAAPQQVMRPRPWSTPDYKILTQNDFYRHFPHDAYADEDNPLQRPLGELVYDEEFTTQIKAPNKVLIKRKKLTNKWPIGAYLIVMEAQDKFGQTLVDKQVMNLYDLKSDKVPDNQLLVVKTDQSQYKVGESVCLQVGTASKEASVILRVEKDKKIVSTQIIKLSDEIKYIAIPVTNKDLGGFVVHYQLVNYNAYIGGSVFIDVPLTQEDLEIETLTFRDKLQPGSQQTWRFKIKGLQKDKFAAELLASMYDASLDQFKPHKWQRPPYIGIRPYYTSLSTNAYKSFEITQFTVRTLNKHFVRYPKNLGFDALNWFGFSFASYYNDTMLLTDEMEVMEAAPVRDKKNKMASAKVGRGIMSKRATLSVEKMEGDVAGVSNSIDASTEETTDFSAVPIRTNFNETAFFYPQLHTDADGNIEFTFTIPEALTRWKLQLLAHTKDVRTAYAGLQTLTQKELMLLPNPPRFLREGDQLTFSTKISNLSDTDLSGKVQLELSDPFTGKALTSIVSKANLIKPFDVTAQGNTAVSWDLSIPKGIQVVQYKIVAKAGNFSDGEQNVLPVVTNSMLVTETLPMWVNSNEQRSFTLEKLKSNTSNTLRNQKLTLEVTSNPVWYAIQALPYLMEYPYECSEQTFSRYYANSLATKILQSNPKIKKVFDRWSSSDALLSNLEKNQELKSLLIQETPWLRDAQSETEQKKRIALLFDLNTMTNELQRAEQKLADIQMSNGGFPWFKGGRYPSRYITQHIATGFGHLNKLHIDRRNQTTRMLEKAIAFLDNELHDDYAKLLERAKIIKEKENDKAKGDALAKKYLEANHLGNIQLHYLYMRSFFPEHPIKPSLQKAVDYYTQQSYTYWNSYTLYQKALIALVAHRNNNSNTAQAIIRSLDENSITNEELGMYWKSNQSGGWYWYQAPIETQALLIETFAEIQKDTKTIDNLKKWLLKNKQTNRWKTTKATTEAVYALLSYGNDWSENTNRVQVMIGNETLDPMADIPNKPEAGTGYFKTVWTGDEITKEKAKVSITKTGNGIAWGALYWQYFENLDKISFATTPLQITKKLFVKTNSDTGEKMTEITASSHVKVGDLIRVRIALKVDRSMEFVHMKDMRASGLEPINVLSKYKYQDGLAYYESTKDASTNFFFDSLHKGVYVFEYDLRANNAGNFSNGITTIQCMYAPEFTSHSEGVRIKIERE